MTVKVAAAGPHVLEANDGKSSSSITLTLIVAGGELADSGGKARQVSSTSVTGLGALAALAAILRPRR